MMNEARARELFPLIRDRSALACPRLSPSYNVTEKRAELLAVDGITGEAYPVAIILEECPYDDRWVLENAHEGFAALLLLLDLAFAEIRRLKPRPEKDYTTQAAMQIKNDAAFRRYLVERHELPAGADEERVKIRLKAILQIESLKCLRQDIPAAERWKSLQHDFKTWMRETR